MTELNILGCQAQPSSVSYCPEMVPAVGSVPSSRLLGTAEHHRMSNK